MPNKITKKKNTKTKTARLHLIQHHFGPKINCLPEEPEA